MFRVWSLWYKNYYVKKNLTLQALYGRLSRVEAKVQNCVCNFPSVYKKTKRICVYLYNQFLKGYAENLMVVTFRRRCTSSFICLYPSVWFVFLFFNMSLFVIQKGRIFQRHENTIWMIEIISLSDGSFVSSQIPQFNRKRENRCQHFSCLCTFEGTVALIKYDLLLFFISSI